MIAAEKPCDPNETVIITLELPLFDAQVYGSLAANAGVTMDSVIASLARRALREMGARRPGASEEKPPRRKQAPRREWEQHELDTLKRMTLDGKGATAIGRVLGRDPGSVSNKRRLVGLPAVGRWKTPRSK